MPAKMDMHSHAIHRTRVGLARAEQSDVDELLGTPRLRPLPPAFPFAELLSEISVLDQDDYELFVVIYRKKKRRRV